jgi:hypothetical protein
MLVALGFLAASLLGLLLASAFWSRAVRLTTQRIKQSMPVSEPEIKADRDRLRAEYAIRVHKLETELNGAKLERARQLIEINRREASISTLNTKLAELTLGLEEHQNARRVLEQTVGDRLPKVEARLAEAKRLLFNRDREIAELMQGAKHHRQALDEAASRTSQQNAQIDRLNSELATRVGRGRQLVAQAKFEGEAALRAAVEGLRAKARDQALLIDRLLKRGHGYLKGELPSAAAALSAAEAVTEGELDRMREHLEDAEAALNAPRGSADGEAARTAFEREARALKARAEDQSGEIARLKAALSAFEQADATGGIKDSKIALKARLGSAQAQAEQQAATIGKLRVELAQAHERLARQAAHFMEEMRRIGVATQQGSGRPRRPVRGLAAGTERRTLAERVAQVSPARAAAEQDASPRGEESAEAVATVLGAEAGSAAESTPGGALPTAPQAAIETTAPAAPESNGGGDARPREETGVAAKMPQEAGQIPVARRRLRLLDRIIGHSGEPRAAPRGEE